jgi:hypothetical protein
MTQRQKIDLVDALLLWQADQSVPVVVMASIDDVTVAARPCACGVAIVTVDGPISPGLLDRISDRLQSELAKAAASCSCPSRKERIDTAGMGVDDPRLYIAKSA